MKHVYNPRLFLSGCIMRILNQWSNYLMDKSMKTVVANPPPPSPNPPHFCYYVPGLQLLS